MRMAMVCTPILEYEKDKLRLAYMDNCSNNPYLAPYLLASILERKGYDINIVDLTYHDDFNRTLSEKLLEYDVLLFSCNSTNWPTCRILIEWVKDVKPDQIIILGGLHATLFGEDLIRRFPIDYIVRGEGERVLEPLLQAIEKPALLNTVPGLIWKKKDIVIKNSLPQLLNSEELGTLPIPLFSQISPGKYKTIGIESSRGCFGACSFCAAPFKCRWRSISPKMFVEKVKALQPYLNKVETKNFAIIDDCFTASKQRAITIAEEAERQGIAFHATYNARVKDFLDEKLVSKLAPYTLGVLIGAESFLPETQRLIGKNICSKDIVASAKVAERVGISEKTFFSFIIGFPWETKKQVQDNVSRIADLSLTHGVRIFIQWHTLMPGSTIWEKLFRQKRILISDMDEIGFLSEEKWFKLSSSLSIEERLEISDMIICIQRIIAFTKPSGSRRGDIYFTIPQYLIKNPKLTEKWRNNYNQKMDNIS